jgi:hypothetical protein
LNLDDIYEVDPDDLNDLFDTDSSELELEYIVSSPLEEDYNLLESESDALVRMVEKHKNNYPTAGEMLDPVFENLSEPKLWGQIGKVAAPAIAGAVVGAAVPPLGAGWLATVGSGALGGVAGGAVTRGVSNLVNGKPLGEGSTLGTVMTDAALGGGSNLAIRAATPYVVRGAQALGRGAARLAGRLPQRTPAVSTLPGYDQALTLRSPLPDVEPMPNMMHDQPDMRVARDDLDMSLMDDVRTGVSSSEFVLRRSQRSQAAQIAGRRIRGMNRDTHTERALAEDARDRTGVANLDENERRAVTVALAGRFDELPPQWQTQRVRDAATLARDEFYDAASEKLLANRAGTVVTQGPDRGQVVQYAPRANYIPWIPAEPRRGAARLRELLANRGRTPQTMFQRTGERGPDTQALEELWGIEGPQSTNWVTDADEAMRIYIDGGRGRVGYPELVARSRHFGPILEQHPDAAHPWGHDANILYQQMLEATAPLEAELFKDTMESIYRPDRPGPGERALTWLKNQVSHTLLGQTAATQLTQAGTPAWRFGFLNDLRGKYDYLRDPSFRRLTNLSGAQDAAYARELADYDAVGPRATRAVEESLRGFGNAGAKPYLEDLVERAATGNVNAATRKQLEELGLSLDDVADGVNARNLRQALEESAHRNQFHPYDPGGSGEWFTGRTGRALTMYQPFGHAAWRNLQEDIIEPLLGPQGWRRAYQTGDYSLQRLGAARAARLPVAALPAAAVAEGVKSAVGLRGFDPMRAATTALESNVGTPAMLGTSFFGGYRPENNFIPPWLSLAGQQVRNLQSGHPERVLIDAAAWADPTGWMAVAHPTLQNMTKEERR